MINRRWSGKGLTPAFVLLLLLQMAACTSRQSAQYSKDIQNHAIHDLYNSLVKQLKLDAYLCLAEFPPIVYVKEWEAWIADERNVEFKLDWQQYTEDEYFQRYQFRLRQAPGYLHFATVDRSANGPFVTFTVKQQPSLHGAPVLMVACKSMGRYVDARADWTAFIYRNGQWAAMEPDVLPLPSLNTFFPEGTDVSLIQKHGLVEFELQLSQDSLEVGITPLSNGMAGCDEGEEQRIEISPDEKMVICNLLDEMDYQPILHVWDFRRHCFVRK